MQSIALRGIGIQEVLWGRRQNQDSGRNKDPARWLSLREGNFRPVSGRESTPTGKIHNIVS